eukprot:TRINITY_DN88404_c0_g1_i1.p1 TRINITY_DN88404_c0_g1~~TRINITY_DN88404_c0_g1_i1.p1  ORF type:complete len:193 (-),score=6.84 TRINITY_DN88404_c0_g1_i1:507-1061(-)
MQKHIFIKCSNSHKLLSVKHRNAITINSIQRTENQFNNMDTSSENLKKILLEEASKDFCCDCGTFFTKKVQKASRTLFTHQQITESSSAQPAPTFIEHSVTKSVLFGHLQWMNGLTNPSSTCALVATTISKNSSKTILYLSRRQPSNTQLMLLNITGCAQFFIQFTLQIALCNSTRHTFYNAST